MGIFRKHSEKILNEEHYNSIDKIQKMRIPKFFLEEKNCNVDNSTIQKECLWKKMNN